VHGVNRGRVDPSILCSSYLNGENEVAMTSGRASDDGVGRERTMAECGKEGHFGLRGMREHRRHPIGDQRTGRCSPGQTRHPTKLD
jgi:hypothetical protein